MHRIAGNTFALRLTNPTKLDIESFASNPILPNFQTPGKGGMEMQLDMIVVEECFQRNIQGGYGCLAIILGQTPETEKFILEKLGICVLVQYGCIKNIDDKFIPVAIIPNTMTCGQIYRLFADLKAAKIDYYIVPGTVCNIPIKGYLMAHLN